jgi:hypothetical protein
MLMGYVTLVHEHWLQLWQQHAWLCGLQPDY